MKYRTGAVGLAALTVAGLVPALLAPAQAAGTTCAFSDASGDGTGIIVGIEQPVYSESSLDIVSGKVEWLATEQVARFTIEVEDLSELPPLGTNGEYFDFNFTANGDGYYAQYYNSRADGDQRWVLGRLGDTGRQTIATSTSSNIAGTADVDTDLITIDIPAAVQLNAGGVAWSIPDGAQLGGFEISARRELVLLVPDADTATDGSGCTVTASGVATTDLGLPIVDVANPTWSKSRTLTAGAAGVCAAGCVTERIEVRPGASTKLTVNLVATSEPLNDNVNDLDLIVTGPGGERRAENPGNSESVSFTGAALQPGIYTITVSPYLAVASEMTLSAALS